MLGSFLKMVETTSQPFSPQISREQDLIDEVGDWSRLQGKMILERKEEFYSVMNLTHMPGQVSTSVLGGADRALGEVLAEFLEFPRIMVACVVIIEVTTRATAGVREDMADAAPVVQEHAPFQLEGGDLGLRELDPG